MCMGFMYIYMYTYAYICAHMWTRVYMYLSLYVFVSKLTSNSAFLTNMYTLKITENFFWCCISLSEILMQHDKNPWFQKLFIFGNVLKRDQSEPWNTLVIMHYFFYHKRDSQIRNAIQEFILFIYFRR